MAEWQQQDGWSNYNQQQNWNTGQSDPNFQSQDFQQFDYGQQQYSQDTSGYGSVPPATNDASPYLTGGNEYTGAMFIPDASQHYGEDFGQAANEFEGEPPLLEELGINPDHILQKTLAVLNPLGSTQAVIAGDSDLAGPLCFCLAFGSLLMFSGKLHFNYIYGIGLLGCLAMYGLLNLMALSGVSFGTVVSVLGYCLLPIVGLSGLSILFSLTGLIGNILTGLSVIWCTASASKLFVTALDMRQQQLLVAYPCAMLYGVFALITMF